MAINFPNSPNVNDTFTDNNISYIFDGTKWKVYDLRFDAYPTGGGNDEIFYQNDVFITQNYDVPTNKNSMTAGPVTISDGVTITIPTGARWVVV